MSKHHGLMEAKKETQRDANIQFTWMMATQTKQI